jgi:hypothetical protein
MQPAPAHQNIKAVDSADLSFEIVLEPGFTVRILFLRTALVEVFRDCRPGFPGKPNCDLIRLEQVTSSPCRTVVATGHDEFWKYSALLGFRNMMAFG